MPNVCIIGAGASGLMAAIFAARGGNKVMVLEKGPKACRKVLASGNGKCNLTNALLRRENFHSQNPEIAWPVVTAFDNGAVRSFFASLGLLTKEEAFGRVLPFAEQARAVAEVLEYEARSLGVDQRFNEGVARITRSADGFAVETYAGKHHKFGKLVVACGGPSYVPLGGTWEGMTWARDLGHQIHPVSPAIVGLSLEGNWHPALQGVRQDVGLSAEDAQGQVLESGMGELLFSKTGISGPVVFDVSRALLAEVKARRPDWGTPSKKPCVIPAFKGAPRLFADFFKPYHQNGEVLLRYRWSENPGKPLAFSFVGFLQAKLAPVLLQQLGYSKADLERPVGKLRDADLKKIGQGLAKFELKVSGCRPFNEAQALSGGVSLAGLNPQTLESKKVPGLYFCGEVLDVVGDCGGYNLQWAWSSGYAVGRHLSPHLSPPLPPSPTKAVKGYRGRRGGLIRQLF